MQPCIQQFIHVLLGEQLTNPRFNIRKRNRLAPGFCKIRKKLALVVRLNLFRLNVNIGTEAYFDEVHDLQFSSQVRLQQLAR